MATEMEQLQVKGSNGTFTFEIADPDARKAANDAKSTANTASNTAAAAKDTAEAAKAAAEKITIPTALPNPKKLKFTGGATGEYDGSAEVTITIPTGGESGGSGDCNIQRIESLDESNLNNLRDLDSGTYILYGYFNPFSGSPDSITIDSCIAAVVHLNAGSHVMVYNPRNFKIECYEILGNADEGYSYTRDVISMLDLRTNAAVRVAEITLLAANWKGDASPYSQVVAIDGITPYSQVDLTPSVEQLTIFHDKDLAFVTENEDGTVTVYAIGQKPENDYTIQATIKEVAV